MLTYKDSGVNVKNGDDFSDFLYKCAKRTWGSKKGLRDILVPYDDFSGIRYINVSNLPNGTVMGMNFDGIGTKVGLAELLGEYRFLAFDLFAMVCDDAASMGAEPILVGTIMDVDKIVDIRSNIGIKDIGISYVEAARDANVVIINGEVAELGDRINGNSSVMNLNWGASCVWFAKKSNLIDRSKIVDGDYLVGIEENGFRSNGYSLVRKIVDKNFKNMSYKYNTIFPSTIYTRALVDLTGGYHDDPKSEIHGIAHITGGGLYGKVKRMLKPCGLGANIGDPFEPPYVMKYIQEIGRVSDKEAYRTWNMGNGIVIATPDPKKVISITKKHGFNTKIIGEVIKEKTIFIRNLGSFARTDFLEFRDA